MQLKVIRLRQLHNVRAERPTESSFDVTWRSIVPDECCALSSRGTLNPPKALSCPSKHVPPVSPTSQTRNHKASAPTCRPTCSSEDPAFLLMCLSSNSRTKRVKTWGQCKHAMISRWLAPRRLCLRLRHYHDWTSTTAPRALPRPDLNHCPS